MVQYLDMNPAPARWAQREPGRESGTLEEGMMSGYVQIIPDSYSV